MSTNKLPDYILLITILGMFGLAVIDEAFRDDFTHIGNTVLLFYMGRASTNIPPKPKV